MLSKNNQIPDDMIRILLSCCICSLFLFSCGEQRPPQNPDTAPFPELSAADSTAIVETFLATQEAWNRGDLASFMEAYWNSEEVSFVGVGGPIYGYDATLQRYRNSYPDRETMGTLKFDILKLYRVDTATAILIGKFYLTRSIPDLQGHYTLVWRKIDGRWVIITDHSSGEEVEE